MLALFLYPAPAAAAQSPAAQAPSATTSAKSADPTAASPAAQAGGIRFDDIHLGLAANPPASCIAQLQTSNTATYISATTTSSFTVTTASTFAAGAKINVICRGYE